MGRMTPIQVHVLLFCAREREKHPRFSSPTIRDAIEFLRETGCIKEETTKNPKFVKLNVYTTTDKGDMLINLICAHHPSDLERCYVPTD